MKRQIKEHLKTVYTEKETVVDEETGEILQEEKRLKVIIGESGSFYQLYENIIALLEDMKPIDIKILIGIFKYASTDNQIGLTKHFKEQVAKDFGIGFSTVANAITELTKKKIMIRSGHSSYRINPRYFWKSTYQTRKATLKYVLEIECPTC